MNPKTIDNEEVPLGGGNNPRLGNVSLTYHGVIYLDEDKPMPRKPRPIRITSLPAQCSEEKALHAFIEVMELLRQVDETEE